MMPASSDYWRYFHNTSWLMMGQVVKLLTGLLVWIYVARYLGPENFGLLNYALAFAGIFSAIAAVGMDGVLVRKLVVAPERRDVLLGSGFVLRLMGTLLMWCALAVAVYTLKQDSLTTAMIALIGISHVFQSVNVIDAHFQAKVLSKYVVMAQVLQTLISAAVKVYLVVLQASLVWFAAASVVDAFVLTALLILIYHKRGGNIFHWCWDGSVVRTIFHDSWPLALSGIAVSAYMRIDQIMIDHMLNHEAVGYYAVAVRLSEAWYFIPVVITASLFPAIVRARDSSRELYFSYLQRLHNLMVAISLLLMLPIAWFATDIINWLYGSQYAPAASLLSIYVWALLFISFGMASDKFLLAENLPRLSLYRTLTGLIVNVILNYVLIRTYGLNGAALATLISYAVAAYGFDMFNRRCRPMFIIKTKAFALFWKLSA